MPELTIITWLVAFVGACLVIALFVQILKIDAEQKLKKHRSKTAGFTDLLNYAAVVDDGVIVNKNGSLMAAWLYRGADNASSPAEERINITVRINETFASMGNGWMFHVDSVRIPAKIYPTPMESNFPDQVSAAIDDERRQYFKSKGTMYEGYFVLTVTFFPPVLAQKKFVEMMFDDDGAPKGNHTSSTLKIINKFKEDIKGIEGKLSLVLELERLKGRPVITEDGRQVTEDDFLAWLQYTVTGISQPVRLPNNPMYIDSLIGGQEFFGGVVPIIGNKYIQIVAIDGFPTESDPDILGGLAELAGEYRWSTRFIFMDPHEAEAALQKFRKKWKQKIRGFFDQVFQTNSGNINHDAVAMVEDADYALTELKSGRVAYGYYTSVVVLMDENRSDVEYAAKEVAKVIQRAGFGARIETVNTIDAYLGSLPGHGVENVRRPLLNTLNVADLLPTSSIWTGQAMAPCPFYPPMAPALLHGVTHGYTPFRLNLHVSDIGHTLMFGPTGAGKSTHLALIAAQLLRYKGMSVYAFDKGMSLYPLTKAVKGRHFSINADEDKLAFCPLSQIKTKEDLAWAGEWIDTILALNGVNTTPGQRNLIMTALESLVADSGPKSLTDFKLLLQETKLREALEPYTIGGMVGHLLDAQEDGLSLTNFCCFEIETLMNMDQKYALPVLLYIFRRIEKNLTGQPAAIILDEAWLMLGHEVFREKIREWLKVLRKANCLVLMATQSLSDAARSGILDVLVENTSTKIFLPNLFARNEDATALYRQMGLNSTQIEIIASAVPKQEYYYSSANGCRLYRLDLGPLALAFVGSSDKESIATIKDLEKKHGDNWVDAWLALKSLSLANYAESES